MKCSSKGTRGSGGAFLYGRFTVADAFFVPVAGCFRTYAPALDDAPQAYVKVIFTLSAMQEWLMTAKLARSSDRC